MARWEYKTVEVKMKGWFYKKLDLEEADQILSEFGRQGWELVGAGGQNTMQGQTVVFLYTFKRALA